MQNNENTEPIIFKLKERQCLILRYSNIRFNLTIR